MEINLFCLGLVGVAVVGIGIVTILLQKITRTLYLKTYAHHMVFEYPQRSWWTIFFYIAGLATLYGIGTKTVKTGLLDDVYITGLVSTFLALYCIPYLASAIVFWYADRHKESMQGTTRFKPELVDMLSKAMLLPSCLLLLMAFPFAPTPFFLGSAEAIVLVLMVQLVTRNRAVF